LLQNGLYIDNISLPNVKLKALYIKWDEKININIKEIDIEKKNTPNKKFDYEKINQYMKKIYLFDNWFQKVDISKIKYDDLIASFHYEYSKKSRFNALSPHLSLNGEIFSDSKLFNINIKEFKSFDKNITINGNIILDSINFKATTSLNIDINKDIIFNFIAHSDKDKLTYKIDSKKKIKTINYLIDMLNLHNALRYWLIDAIDMNNLTINNLYGWIDYNDIDNAYKNIYANATLDKLKYRYDKKLDTINTKTTDIIFRDGILYIYPREAYTYGFYLDKSWLKINFTNKDIPLTLKLKFDAMLNNDILYLLNRYKIKLPFLQKAGDVSTNLEVKVNLKKIKVSAHGEFYTKKANFDYLGLNIDIFDAKIVLDNYDVKIDDMLAKYKDIATTYVDVKLDTKNSNGYINFDIKDIYFKDENLKLLKPLKVIYKIVPKQDTINIDSSKWVFNNQQLDVNKLVIPFYLKKLSLDIPSTLVNAKDMGIAYVNGSVSFKNQITDLNIKIDKFSHYGIEFKNESALFKLLYKDSNIDINSTKNISLKLLGKNSLLNSLNINIKDKKTSLSTHLEMNDTLSTDILTRYNIKNNNGKIDLTNLKIKNKSLGEIFKNKDNIELNLRYINNTTYIRSQEFDINFILSNDYWRFNSNQLSKIVEKSTILKNYLIKDGSIDMIKYHTDDKINFKANINYPYNLILIDKKFINKYSLNGSYNLKTDKSNINLNDKIDIVSDDIINIESKEIGLNINKILSIIRKIKNDNNSTSKSKEINFYAKDSYIYINDKRAIISDKISLKYINKITKANLIYKDGSADFILKGNQFNLHGENFNDKFIENIFSDSKFRGGKLEFYIGGELDNYNGVFYVQDTTILKYKILNNILAFVNTIPSLITFSLPGYNNHGLAVSDAYINFNTKDGDKFDIENVSLDSKEIKIVGRGIADFDKNSIDMKLNLKTDLGSTLSKIPVVGYLFLDNDTISSSLKIVGKLDNPKVKTRLANDIVVAPLNIIKRTLLLPAHLIKDE